MTASQAVAASRSSDPGGRATAPRLPDLILARTHLRLGSLSLARTELETLAGQGTLDDEGIRDLAEARWRTGDLSGAGEAATAWLQTNPDDILGLMIAAEAQVALGRPGEARRLAGRAMDHADGSLDPLFAGMQRSQIWPVEAGGAVGPAGVLFDDLHPGPRPVAAVLAGGPAGGRGTSGAAPHEPFDPGLPAVFGGGASLWGDDAAGMDAAAADALDPAKLFHGGRVALDNGRLADAATGLILALRASPSLAPAVLDLLVGRDDPILVLVRGDAQRVVGHEVEAVRDHATAAGEMANDGMADDEPKDVVPAEVRNAGESARPGSPAAAASLARAEPRAERGPNVGAATAARARPQPRTPPKSQSRGIEREPAAAATALEPPTSMVTPDQEDS